jgi:DNA-binding transcriptional regulator GbsR (MarR family)
MQEERPDPFDSLGASKVFYQLVCDYTTPKEISSKLRIKPPTVVEHLRRLQDVGIVEIGKKKGKYQHYRVLWNKFASVFLEHVPSLVARREILKLAKEAPDTLKGDLTERDVKEFKKRVEIELQSLEKLFNELEKNEYFKKLVKEYSKLLAYDIVELGAYELTLNKAAEVFEESIRLKPLKNGTKNPELSRLSRILKKWGEYSKDIGRLSPQGAFEEAIEKLLG